MIGSDFGSCPVYGLNQTIREDCTETKIGDSKTFLYKLLADESGRLAADSNDPKGCLLKNQSLIQIGADQFAVGFQQ